MEFMVILCKQSSAATTAILALVPIYTVNLAIRVSLMCAKVYES